MTHAQAIDLKDPQFRRILFEDNPAGEIGPYTHQWLASKEN